MPNEIPLVFHDVTKYDYHIIMKELANKFKIQFECLGENTEKYKTFSFPLEKESIKIEKDGNEDTITISQKINLIDNARFIPSLISSLVKNLAEGIHKINAKIAFVFFNAKVFCNKNYSKKIDEKFKEKFKNTFKFPNNNINKFILLLIKRVYMNE